jgi:hypothetical protein
VPNFEAEPDVIFSQGQWAEIAASIPLDPLPPQMKQEICNALFDHNLMSNEQSEAKQRRALKKLVEMIDEFGCSLSELQGDLRPENIIDQVEGLMDQARAARKAASRELKGRPKPKGGRPRNVNRDALALLLIDIFARYSGKRVGLSKSPDAQYPDRLKPGGPCYRFVSAIFRLSKLPTKGLEHVIARAAQHPKNHP